MGLWANKRPSKHRNEYTLGTDYMLDLICNADVENTIIHSKITLQGHKQIGMKQTHTHTNKLHITKRTSRQITNKDYMF